MNVRIYNNAPLGTRKCGAVQVCLEEFDAPIYHQIIDGVAVVLRISEVIIVDDSVMHIMFLCSVGGYSTRVSP